MNFFFRCLDEMKLVCFLLYLMNDISALSFRGYSVLWRNSNNKIVKQAIYNHEAVFTPKFKNELDELNKLPAGYIYDLQVFNSTILYRKRDLIKHDTMRNL